MNSSETNINLKALKKVDPYIVSIEAHCGNVALYKYNGPKGDWEKTEVEGTLFVYQREADPQYGFTIMNRLNMENLVEPVTKDLDFQLQTPFLLYRNHANEIFGIWFYNQDECEKVGKKVEELVKVVTSKMTAKKKQVNGKGDLTQLFKSAETSKQQQAPVVTSSGGNEDTGRNLLRLLSQNEGGSSNGGGGFSMEGITPTNGAVERSTSASVQDFFAKAQVSSAGGVEAPSAFTSVPAMMPGQPPLPITAMPISQGLAQGMVPVGGFHLIGQQPPVSVAATEHAPINPVVQKLMSNPGIHTVDAIEAEQRRSASPNQDHQVIMTPRTRNISDLETDLKAKLHIGSSSLMNNNNDKTFAGPGMQDTDKSGNIKLLGPNAFASPSPPVTNGRSVSPPAGQITPLTQGQLVEAINFLLENDKEFVTKIHQAYVMSLTNKLSK